MHQSSYNEMKRLVPLYAGCGTVIDFGSLSVNGSYRNLFPASQYRYIGADLINGENVDLIMPSEFDTGLYDNCADLVISGQCLEHCRNPFKLVKEMHRVCRYGAHCLLTAPAVGRIHRYPIDCWRILPDGMAELLKDAGFKALRTYTNENDCWGIGVK